MSNTEKQLLERVEGSTGAIIRLKNHQLQNVSVTGRRGHTEVAIEASRDVRPDSS